MRTVCESPRHLRTLIVSLTQSQSRDTDTVVLADHQHKVTSQSEPTEQDLDQTLKETAQLTMVSQLLCVDDSSSSQMILSSYLEFSLDPHRFLMKLINSNGKPQFCRSPVYKCCDLFLVPSTMYVVSYLWIRNYLFLPLPLT